MEIVLSVPETVMATYVVATSSPPADPAAAARAAAGRLEGPLRAAVLAMLDGPLMSVSAVPVAEAPPLPIEHLRAFGAPPEALRAILDASHVVVCQAVFGPGWPPAHEWHTRAVAAGIAADTGGTLIDLFTPRVLDPAAALASLPGPDGRSALSAWVAVPQSPGDRGLWMTTRGLGRFGLPELQVHDVPPALARAWTSALTGLARALVVRWAQAVERAAGAAFVRMPHDLTVTEADAVRAYGAIPGPEAQERATLVQLRLDAEDPEWDALLTVVPPDGFAFSAGEFLARVVAELFGTQSTAVRYAPDDERMQAAVATARDALPQARTRFLAGEFGPERHLIVKHRLTRGEATELIWSTVTTWPDPRRLHGVSMSDAEIDPLVRTGRPTMVREAEIVDWGVWVDGDGIVEGGWTNAVLTGE
ncbi:DUF2314 domain-containing protein [Dactylosporangium matsuzakiense]|uniref:DUF2314 domain-containing protein n=1 Tax=Dactylosporangium matsuzakiense TaxID=53360 RepID=A0A9W6NSA8_9ACTN|nr:DUF2314 domain-containing protein [Dactylosporangium matsuzakiense]UWZ41728.1 DUF2314 domain-containing protein [Dactylosporangium matsuzakiense]GLL07136.1 hypothetical protein GCM10017581_088880 [Dactylosporangium matsuzakiense]